MPKMKTEVKPKVKKTAKPKPTEKRAKEDPRNRKFAIKIENVVAFSVLGIDISLNHVVSSIKSAEYEPEQFPGLVYRTQDPRSAALIFSSGKIVCTGTKSIDLAHIAMGKVVAKLNDIGVKTPKKYPVTIENIVASTKIDAKLSLDDIAFQLEDAEYEPEQFPGLVYRIQEPRVAFLLFSSGKIICTGAHKIDDIYTALGKFKIKLEEIGVDVIPSTAEDAARPTKKK